MTPELTAVVEEDRDRSPIGKTDIKRALGTF